MLIGFKNGCVSGILGILFLSCGPSSNQLSSEQKYTLDTMYSNGLGNIRSYADSLCLARQDSLYLAAVDSLREEYIINIEHYLGKDEE